MTEARVSTASPDPGTLSCSAGDFAVGRYLLPATLDRLPAKLIPTVCFAVFAEATLAFLGLADSGSVSWGTMLSEAFNHPLHFSRPVWPGLVLPPGLEIVAVPLAITWLSSGTGDPPSPSNRRPAGRPSLCYRSVDVAKR